MQVMADALAAAERRKALLSVESTPPPRPKKRELPKRSEGLASASTTASSSVEKVTPDPKAIRTDPEPRVLFGGGISASAVLIAYLIYMYTYNIYIYMWFKTVWIPKKILAHMSWS